MKNYIKNNLFNLLVLIVSIFTLSMVFYNINLNVNLFHLIQKSNISSTTMESMSNVYSDYIQINKFDKYAIYMKGLICYKQRHYPEAIKYLSKYEKIGVKTPSLYRYIGNSYSSLGDNDRAIEIYKKGLKLSPNDSKLLNCIAYVKYLAGYDLQDALEDINLSLSIEPFAEAYHTRAEIERQLGLYNLAISDSDMALKYKPDLYYAYCEKGYSLIQTGHQEEGINNIQKCEFHSKQFQDFKYLSMFNQYLYK